MSRYITTWRKPAPDTFDWDHCTCGSLDETERLVANLKKLGVHQYHTFTLGDQLPELSSDY